MRLARASYFDDSRDGKAAGSEGFSLVSTHGDWDFALEDPMSESVQAPVPQPRPSVKSKEPKPQVQVKKRVR
ncbi:MAG: hypothetical protein M3T49_00120 [Candidatus Eremiobacteraeota bacterium]|nr:hypothetical protein [Candidatus Eremiobacteraeota bacterium]